MNELIHKLLHQQYFSLPEYLASITMSIPINKNDFDKFTIQQKRH